MTHEERAHIQSEYRATELEQNTQLADDLKRDNLQKDSLRKGSMQKASSSMKELQKNHLKQNSSQRRIAHRSKRAATAIADAQLPADICQRLICIADKALYEAKDRGRNQVVSANELLAAEKTRITSLYAIG